MRYGLCERKLQFPNKLSKFQMFPEKYNILVDLACYSALDKNLYSHKNTIEELRTDYEVIDLLRHTSFITTL